MTRLALEQLFDQLLLVSVQIDRYVLQNGAQCANLQWFVAWDGDVVLGSFERGC